MKHRAVVWLVTLACSALPGCGDRVPLPAARSVAIIGGSPDATHTSAGMVVVEDVKGLCTGTLIAPDRVLTAGHCVYEVIQPETFVERVVFVVGDAPGRQVRVAAAAAHPDFLGLMDSDLAVLWLSSPVTEVKPAPLATAAPTLGEQITIVGYGDTSYAGGGSGVRRLGAQTVGDLQALLIGFESTPAICHGDSGGPSFATRGGVEELVGVHTASSQQCVGWGYDMRVDAFHGWITGAKPQVGFYRAVCAQGYPCRSGLCIAAADGEQRCSQGCESAPCPYLDSCIAGTDPSGPAKVCLPMSGGAGAPGEPCSAASDCFSGECVDLGAGAACTKSCNATKDCPTGSECADSAKGRYCVLSRTADAGPGDGGSDTASAGGDTGEPGGGGGGGCAVGRWPRPGCPALVSCLTLLWALTRRHRDRASR